MPDIVGSGRVVAPAPAAVIATVAAPPAGLYDIVVNASVSGAAAADTANMQLNKNAAALANPVPHGISGGNVSTTYKREQLDGVNPVQVLAIGAGTAAIVYEATIELTLTG